MSMKMGRIMMIPKTAQIKIVSHKYFTGIVDKHRTFQPMLPSEARRVLLMMGYKKIREDNEDGCIIEIWELPAGETKS